MRPEDGRSDIFTMSINKAWHQKNRMPENATKEQRIKWHIEHSLHCSCRLPSAKLKQEMDEYLKKQTL